MTMGEVTVLLDYWRDHPPVHLLVAGYVGYKLCGSQPAPDIMALLGADPNMTGLQTITLHRAT